jgi:hypothetical protein
MLAAAAADVAGIGSSLSEANAAAAAFTTRVIPAAEDEVSVAIASLFSSHGTAFQALSAQAAAFHSRFVQALNAGAGAYASTEAANAGLLQTVAQALPVPNVAVSINGFTLLQLGSATATSGTPGDLAIALGMNSAASATTANLLSGVTSHSIAIAMGTGSTASAGFNGNHDTAIAMGAGSTASAGAGNHDIATAMGTGSTASAGFNGNHDTATVMGTDSTASAGFNGSQDRATVNGNMLTATATGLNHSTDIEAPYGLRAHLEQLIEDPSLLVPNAAISAFGHPLVQLGTAHATSGFGDLAVAVGANSDATTGGGVFNCAFALGGGSDATANPGFFGGGEFDTAIAVGTNDVAVAGGSTPFWPPGGPVPLVSVLPRPSSFDTAFVLGTGSTAGATYGNHNLAAVFGNVQTATATGANRLVDIVTPFGTL